MSRKFILAVCGASGSIYARQTLNALLKDQSITEIAVILSDTAKDVMAYENQELDTQNNRVKIYDNHNFFSPTASGSSSFESMIVVPCSSGTLARIASGVCSDLISRSADVMLKERKRLVLALRETPLSQIHLNNMTTLSQCGAIIMPLSPAFYPQPKSIDELTKIMAERVALSAGANIEHYSWDEQTL